MSAVAEQRAEQTTEVGEHKITRSFEVRFVVQGLRHWVDMKLVERCENHQEAAKRAGVSKAYWSRLMNAERLTFGDLTHIANGLETNLDAIKRALRQEPAEKNRRK